MPLHVGKGRTVGRAIKGIIDYVENPQKTDNGKLISSSQCDSRIADAEFLFSKRQYLFKNLYSKAFEQSMGMGNNDHSLGRRDRNYIILTEAPGMVEPGESTFHHPAPRKFFPLMRFNFL